MKIEQVPIQESAPRAGGRAYRRVAIIRGMVSELDQLVDEVARLSRGTGGRAERAQRVVNLVRSRGGYRWVGVYTVDASSVSVDAYRGPGAPAFPSFPRDRGLSGAAIAARDVVVSNDVARDPRYLTNLDSTGSELIAPVVASGDVVGTLDIESDRTDAFTDADVQLARRLAAALVALWS